MKTNTCLLSHEIRMTFRTKILFMISFLHKLVSQWRVFLVMVVSFDTCIFHSAVKSNPPCAVMQSRLHRIAVARHNSHAPAPSFAMRACMACMPT